MESRVQADNAPLKSTPFTIGFFSNPTQAAVAGQANVDPSHFFTPRQAVEARNLSRGERAGKSTKVQHPGKSRMPPRIGSGHLLPLRALVFRPCVRGLESM
jgi:hypothetical protein